MQKMLKHGGARVQFAAAGIFVEPAVVVVAVVVDVVFGRIEFHHLWRIQTEIAAVVVVGHRVEFGEAHKKKMLLSSSLFFFWLEVGQPSEEALVSVSHLGILSVGIVLNSELRSRTTRMVI